MKKQITICRYSFFSWLSSTKIMIFLLYFTVAYQLFIKPYIEFSKQIDSPLGAFEPFLILTSMPYAASLLPILMIILLCDIPIIDASNKFVIYRTGKSCWFFGQMLFIISISLVLQMLIMLFSIIINRNTFLANGWSLPIRYALTENSNIISAFALDGTITNQIRPFHLVILSFVMNVLHTLTIGLIQYCFALVGKRVFGVLVNIALIGIGFCLWFINIPYKWILPLSHALYTGHYDAFYNKTYCNIYFSYIYFAVVIISLFITAFKLTKKSSFHNIEVVD